MLFVILLLLLLLLVIVYLVRNHKKSKQRDAFYKNMKCTGCKTPMTGEIIKVTGPEFRQALHYCTQECKLEHIERDKIKFAEIEVI
jgi:hypothetical protein